jgi:hypothetical protein
MFHVEQFRGTISFRPAARSKNAKFAGFIDRQSLRLLGLFAQQGLTSKHEWTANALIIL